MKLTKKQKAKWLKALRSGEYKQTTGTLYDEHNHGFCCLGVLQHCLSDGSVEYSEDWEGNPDEPRTIPSVQWYHDNGIVLDNTLANADTSSDPMETQLMDFNDGNIMKGVKKKGFRGIAQWIEKNVGTID